MTRRSLPSLGEGRPMRVLHAIHDFLPKHPAGSEIYVDALCRAQRDKCLVTVLTAEHDLGRPHGELRWRQHDGLPVVEVVNNWAASDFEDTYACRTIGKRVEQVLDAVQPDIIHLHNLLNLSFSLPALAHARRIPVVATLHDYTLVCPSGGQRVHRADAHVCHQIDAVRCARCFAESPFATLVAAGRLGAAGQRAGVTSRVVGLMTALAGMLRRRVPVLTSHAGAFISQLSPAARPTAGDIQARLDRAREVYRELDLVVAPSASVAREMASLGFTGPRVEVSDYGFRAIVPAPRGTKRASVCLGFMGTLVWHKGLHVLLDAVRQLPSTGWELEIHGDEKVFPDYSAALLTAAHGLPVRFCGPFDHDRVSTVVNRFDALVVPSIWLENSPLVIHEAMMARVPVIGARIGGIVDLIEDGRNGRLYDAHSSADLASVLRSVLGDPVQLERFAATTGNVKSIDADGREWVRRYEAVLAERRPGGPVS